MKEVDMDLRSLEDFIDTLPEDEINVIKEQVYVWEVDLITVVGVSQQTNNILDLAQKTYINEWWDVEWFEAEIQRILEKLGCVN